jgi:quinol monooxygenase YgiN
MRSLPQHSTVEVCLDPSVSTEASVSVVRINEFQATESRRDELRAVLQSILSTVRAADGCLSCQLLESESDPQKFVVIESWCSRDAHQAAASRLSGDELRRAMTLVADLPRAGYYVEIP